jgi:hypothetical protein
MSLKTYTGSCHCGAIRFEADVDLTAGSNRCNCSLCFKGRTWFAVAEGPERFRLLSGSEALGEYRWTPPGKPHPFLTHVFCRHCGIRVFGHGQSPAPGTVFHAILLTVLDDATIDELAASPLNFFDGRHDRFDQPPADTRAL